MMKALTWVAVLLLLAAACTPAATDTPQTADDTPQPEAQPTTTEPGGPIVSPYISLPVSGVEVRTLDSDPLELEITIFGTLPDQCQYDFAAVESRIDDLVRINLHAIHPDDSECDQSEQSVDYVLVLGRDLPEAERGFAPGDYRLIVNDYEMTFSIEE